MVFVLPTCIKLFFVVLPEMGNHSKDYLDALLQKPYTWSWYALEDWDEICHDSISQVIIELIKDVYKFLELWIF